MSKGQYNFDRVVYRYYQDNAISIEAFKAGEFDFLMEYSARRWARQHSGPKWDDGRIIKEEFPTGFGMGLQAYYFNPRRPLFQDRRVREALSLAYDFASINIYKQYKRVDSLFANSEFAAKGEPTPAELALLEPFRGELPPAMFGPAWQDPRTDLDPNGLRNNLKRARKLLEEAGWKVDAEGVLRNAKGEAFEFEWLEAGEAPSRREAIFQRNLALLGIKLNVRVVDFALYRKRLETFDFDMINLKSGDWALPNAADLKAALGSAAADEQALRQLRRHQEQGDRRPGRADGQGEDDGRAAHGDALARPRVHARALRGARPHGRQQPRVPLGQVRHPEGACRSTTRSPRPATTCSGR